jgi:hypothetical protein
MVKSLTELTKLFTLLIKCVLKISLLVLFLNESAFSQLDLKFIQHLSQLELKQEHECYLKSHVSKSDSFELLSAKYYLQYNADSLFLSSIKNCALLLISDTNFLNYANAYFMKKLNPNRDVWFNFLNAQAIQTNKYLELYNLSKTPDLRDTIRLPDALKKDFITYEKAFKKKPWISATLSALIPGLGEFYIGNFQASITKFLSLTLFGIQSVESMLLLGVIQPLPIINIGIFSIFYGANIIGSYSDTKKKKQDFKHQFLLHAANYYSTTFKPSLY